ncbi:grpE protein homolog 2, mitochondrial isoform X2 [Dendropsophus ebraccatus]|uniref:grpE protein homolog 2, mitochondrial isoform X2 n=1 Tax=Dendropsophus ebraccatus TaxID=150705 RepID=UPI003831A3DF
MAGLGLRAAAGQLRVLLSHGARYSRCSACDYSTTAQQTTSGGQTTSSGGSNDGQNNTIKSLEMKTAKLEEQIRDLTEQYRKAVADATSVRRKTQKFVEDAKLFGIQSFCRDLVEVADMLEQAVIESEEQGKMDVSETLSSIQGKLQSIFTKHGLLKMTPVGEDYDPYDHEVVAHLPAEGMRHGSVTTIKQDGYKLHGRTIRHAHVGIAVQTQQ